MHNFFKLSLLTFLLFPTLSMAKPNVLDYYNEISKQSDILNHQIFYKNGKYITYAEAFYPEPLYENITVVDKKNGYIFFLDEGTGAGGCSYEFVLFRDLEKIPYIGVVFNTHDTIKPTLTSKLTFYEKEIDGWYETPTLWNEISLEDFLPDDFTIENFKFLKSSLGATIYYKLPRKGLVGEAQLHFTYGLDNKICKKHSDIFEFDRGTVDYFCKEINHNKKIMRIIKIKWDKKTAQFKVIGKSNKLPKKAIDLY